MVTIVNVGLESEQYPDELHTSSDSEPVGAVHNEAKTAHLLSFARQKNLIQEWKSEGVYPYSAGPVEPAQAVEREMSDEVATRIARRLPGVSQSKKTTLRLLR